MGRCKIATLAALGGDQPPNGATWGEPFLNGGLSAKEHPPHPAGKTRWHHLFPRQVGCAASAAGNSQRSLRFWPCKPQALRCAARRFLWADFQFA